MRLLLVEDDQALATHLRRSLRDLGYATDVAADGIDAQHLGETEQYDAVILDLGLPGRSGLEVLRHWRSHDISVPVLILTARDAWQEKVDGLKSGADDYVTKPFRFEELEARLGAIVRRAKGKADDSLRVGGIALDLERHLATLADGTEVSITGTEFRILRYLMLHPGQPVSRSRLYEHIYEYDDERDSNVIEVYIRRLRAKLGRDAIVTLRGQGYLFSAGPP